MVPEKIAEILRTTRTVAVLGAHHEAQRPAFYVPEYLREVGYRVLPVNGTLVGHALWGQTVRASLTELTEAVDVVDVFRRAESLPGHLDEILAMRPLPRVVWFQAGIRNDDVARALEAAGITVVQDRCMLADRRAM